MSRLLITSLSPWSDLLSLLASLSNFITSILAFAHSFDPSDFPQNYYSFQPHSLGYLLYLLPRVFSLLDLCLTGSLTWLMKMQLTITLRRKKERNFIQAKLRSITREADSQKALRTVPPLRSRRHSRIKTTYRYFI